MSHARTITSRLPFFFFFLIVLLAAYLRLYNTYWDGGTHLHPDERMIIMVAERVRLPVTAAEYDSMLTPDSALNPKFFAYGSFPIYLLKITGWIFGNDNYDGLLATGRTLSALIDTASVVLVFFVAKLLVESRSTNHEVRKKLTTHHSPLTTITPYLAMFFYAVSVLPIQSSHFFISDMPLTFLSLATLLGLLVLQHTKRPIFTAVLIGCCFGLALATKITAILLAAPIAVGFLFWFMKKRNISLLLLMIILSSVSTVAIFAAAMPYGIIDFSTFKAQTLEQSRMRVDPYVFPFTLQYVGTTPYWYFIKNILLWGMGLPLGILAFAGTLWIFFNWIKNTVSWLKHHRKPITNNQQLITILLLFFFLYFGFMGKSAVKFMRYMHPIYPLLCLFAAMFVSDLSSWLVQASALPKLESGTGSKSGSGLRRQDRNEVTSRARDSGRASLAGMTSRFLLPIIVVSVLVWPLSFMRIYTRTHSRVAASDWINATIPHGSKLAIEHWDDALPIGTGHFYQFLEMPMYEDDTNPRKWEQVDKHLAEADYLILSSNRLYVPLQRLNDCSRYKRCFPQTAEYYRKLFAGELGYELIKEFSSYPTIPFLNIPIIDDDADESFTVYDHPKVLIFKKSAFSS